MDKQFILDTLKSLDNASVCNTFEDKWCECKECPLSDDEGLCMIEILISKVKKTME